MDKVLLIDGNNFVWRGNVTFGKPVEHEVCLDSLNDKHMQELHCACGSPWDEQENYCYGDKYKLIYSFFRNLRPLIEDFAPEKCFFVLEGHPQFRYDLYADYKANRFIKTASSSNREKVYQAIDDIIPLLLKLPITIARAEKYECDDTVGSLCENIKEEDLTVVSNDSDYIQLLQRNYIKTAIYNPYKKEYMQAPSYPYVAWKCLNGDKSDNIPALLKPAKALKTINDPVLFQQFMDIEENRANFSINRQLIEFRAVPEDEIFIQDGSKDFESLKREFSLMKFESIINEKSWEKFYRSFESITL
jgi:5'-3' exonuclease